MSDHEVTEKLNQAKTFARDNIRELVRNFRTMKATGVRPDGTAYDKLLGMCSVFNTNSMSIANSILIDAALQHIEDLDK